MLFAGFGVLLGSPGSLTVLVLMGFVCPVGLEFAMRQQGMWRGIVSARYLGALVLHVTVPLCWRKVWEVSGECITPGSPVGPTSCRTGISAAPDLEELGKVRTKRTRHRAGVSPGRPSKPVQARTPAPVPAFFFPPLGINPRSAAQAGVCLLLPQPGSAMQPPVACSCTIPGSPGQ